MTDRPGRTAELTNTFNYTQLDTETRTTLQGHATRFKALAQDAALGLWQMGEILADAQERLASYSNGTFVQWVTAETGLTVGTAYRLMNVYRAFPISKLENVSFATSALYALSEPSTPPQARAEAIYRAQRGEAITYTKAVEITAAYKPLPEPPPRPAPLERTEAYRTFEREVLRPQLHDAGKPDSPQMLTGRHGPLVEVPPERKEQARLGLREAIVERFVSVRRAVANSVHRLLGDCDYLDVLNDPRYTEMWGRLVADRCDLQDEDHEELCVDADELLTLLGQGTNSIAVAARFGVALCEGPKTLNDLTEIAIWTCGETMDGLDREAYLMWRKRSLRLLDAISYTDGAQIFEHEMANGQLVYGLVDLRTSA